MRIICILFAFFGFLLKSTVANHFKMSEVVRINGYPFENISVVTEDGYILDLFRIEHGRNGTTGNHSPVLLMHGILGYSKDYVALGPDRGLAYILADRGYDVWLGNARGTTYSRKHITLDPDVNSTFWNFSWHEIGIYDLPAIINTIKNVTQQSRLAYIGISMGTTVSYVLGSERSEYNRDLSVIISLAPVAFMRDFKSPLLLFASRFEHLIDIASKLTNIYEVPPPHLKGFVNNIIWTLCHKDSALLDVCAALGFFVAGPSPSQLNKTELYTMFGSFSPCSIRQLLHYSQLIHSGQFRQYNYGPMINLKKYKTFNVPKYDLSKITAPVALFYSNGDWLAQPEDVEMLCRKLSNCALKRKVKLETFNHFDYLFATDVVSLLFDDVIRVLDKYSL